MTSPPVAPYTPDDLDFPNNVTIALQNSFQSQLSGLNVFLRPLRTSDPNVSIGIFVMDWNPTEMEIGNPGPTISQYLYNIQAFVKDGDEQRGLRGHATLSKRVRSVLYRSVPTRLALGALSVTDPELGSTERYQRSGVRQQRFVNNQIQGQFLYLSTMEFWLETETV